MTAGGQVLVVALGIAEGGQKHVRDWLVKHGGDPMRMTQPEFARFVLEESESAKRIVKAAGVSP
jgi:hypothetical protein